MPYTAKPCGHASPEVERSNLLSEIEKASEVLATLDGKHELLTDPVEEMTPRQLRRHLQALCDAINADPMVCTMEAP
jgi:hypothetical protein